MSMSMSLNGIDLSPAPVFAYDRETWERMWENSRLTRISESMRQTSRISLELVLAGKVEEAVAPWGQLAEVWALMLGTPAEQAAAIRGSA